MYTQIYLSSQECMRKMQNRFFLEGVSPFLPAFLNVFINQAVSEKIKYCWFLFYDNKALKGTKYWTLSQLAILFVLF